MRDYPGPSRARDRDRLGDAAQGFIGSRRSSPDRAGRTARAADRSDIPLCLCTDRAGPTPRGISRRIELMGPGPVPGARHHLWTADRLPPVPSRNGTKRRDSPKEWAKVDCVLAATGGVLFALFHDAPPLAESDFRLDRRDIVPSGPVVSIHTSTQTTDPPRSCAQFSENLEYLFSLWKKVLQRKLAR
jgi:hypothetical protein